MALSGFEGHSRHPGPSTACKAGAQDKLQPEAEGRDLRPKSLGRLHETPAFVVPAKYYFAGCPFAGVPACRGRQNIARAAPPIICARTKGMGGPP
jgi:hypothetical protein